MPDINPDLSSHVETACVLSKIHEAKHPVNGRNGCTFVSQIINMLTKIKSKIQERVRPIIWDNLQVELNEIPENPILVGAAAIAAQRVFENPAEFIK